MDYLSRSHSTSSLHSLSTLSTHQPPPHLAPAATIDEVPSTRVSVFANLRRKPPPNALTFSTSKSAPSLSAASVLFDEDAPHAPSMPGAFEIPAPAVPAPTHQPASSPNQIEVVDVYKLSQPSSRAVLRQRVLNLPAAALRSARGKDASNPTRDENTPPSHVASENLLPRFTSVKSWKAGLAGSSSKVHRKVLGVTLAHQLARKKKAQSLLKLDGHVSPLDALHSVNAGQNGSSTIMSEVDVSQEQIIQPLADTSSSPPPPESLVRKRRTRSLLSFQCSEDASDQRSTVDTLPEVVQQARSRSKRIPPNLLVMSVAHRRFCNSPGTPLNLRFRATARLQDLAGALQLIGDDQAPMIPPIGTIPRPCVVPRRGRRVWPSLHMLNPALFPRAGDLAHRAQHGAGDRFDDDAARGIDEYFAREGVPLHVITRAIFHYEIISKGTQPNFAVEGLDVQPRTEQEAFWSDELRHSLSDCAKLPEEYRAEAEKDGVRRWDLRWRLLNEERRRRDRVVTARDALYAARRSADSRASRAASEKSSLPSSSPAGGQHGRRYGACYKPGRRSAVVRLDAIH